MTQGKEYGTFNLSSFQELYFYSDSGALLCQAVFIEISVSNTGDQKDMQPNYTL